jgi:hypothetical protein
LSANARNLPLTHMLYCYHRPLALALPHRKIMVTGFT